MAAPQGRIRVRHQDHTVYFQVEGWGTMRQSVPFRRYAEHCLTEGAFAVRVDLRRCAYLDSTFLGTLISLQRAAAGRGREGFAIVSPSAPCSKILHQMGLDRLFPSVSEEEAGADGWTDVSCEGDDPRALQSAVVEAHQELANLDGPTREAFRDVARSLTEAMKAERR